MERYRIKIKKIYVFDLDGENEKEIKKQINVVMNESRILDLPYINKSVKVSTKKIKKERVKNETNS